MDTVELIQKLDQLKSGLQAHLDTQIKPLLEWQKEKDGRDEKNQLFIDEMAKQKKFSGNIYTTGNRTFSDVFSETLHKEFSNKQADIKSLMSSKDAKFSFAIDTKQSTMLSTSHLVGDAMASYRPQVDTIPASRVNFRDLVSVVRSDTGVYVGYQESASGGAFAEVAEGAAKPQLDYTFTEVKTVSGYIAGFARFSKQLAYNLPFLTGTLQRLLQRDFWKRENETFYAAAVAAASGPVTTSETDVGLMLVDILSARGDSDFANSFILTNNAFKGVILKSLYNTGNLQTVIGLTPAGGITIVGIPLYSVSWANAGTALIADGDFIERVETESMRFEASYEDQDNFIKNLVTSRLECFEALNILRGDAISYLDTNA